MEHDFARNLSEALGILAVIGVIAGLMRWHNASRKIFLLAFIVSLIGMAIREVPVVFWGTHAWPAPAIWLSALGRAVQILGAGIFVWAALRDHCGPTGCLLIFGAAFVVAFLL